MDKFTIYCTEAQTKKALELGAPIVLSEKRDIYNDYPQEIPGKIGKYFTFEEAYSCCFCNNYGAYIIPTAEEMIGWLEEQGLNVFVEAQPFDRCRVWISKIYNINYPTNYHSYKCLLWKECTSLKQATLAAIDAALEYLVENNLIK